MRALVRLGKSVLALSLAWLATSCGPTESNGPSTPTGVAQFQTSARPGYSARKRGAERFEASHPGMQLETTFERGRVLVASRAGASEGLDLAVAAIGCEGELLLSTPASPALDSAQPNRVEYAHAGGFTEWYVNGPAGLEQGFTIRELPDCARSGQKLVIQLAENAGWHSSVSEDGSRATLRGPSGERLQYGELRAEDARGKELPIRVAKSDGLALELEAEGAALPIAVDPLVWVEQQKLTATDGAVSDYFGSSVSLSGESALVGAYGNTSYGSAYVYVRSGTSWSEQQKLTSSDGADGDDFGYSVSLSGESALVGALGDASYRGSAYVFVRSGTSWSEQQKLTATDGAVFDYFGYSVSLSGESALVGAYQDDDKGTSSGSAYVFVRSGTSWSEQRKLTASDGAASDHFGYSVSLSGESALVGAYQDDDKGTNSGSAYVFVRSGTSWSEQQKLTASDGAALDYFGSSVSLSGDSALVGAYQDDDKGTNSGSAYVFVRSGTSWSDQRKLTASDGAASDAFGFSVSLSGDSALVGAYGDDDTVSDAGSAYGFVRSGTSWSDQRKLTASDGAASDAFGFSVSLSGDSALVGAYLGDGTVSDAGSAYVFVTRSSDGDNCTLDDDCVSDHCIDSVCCNIDCTGACAACSTLAGADTDGVCKVFAAGSAGSPSCAPQACNGSSMDCVACAHDSECPSGKYCAADGTCQSQKNGGDACDLAQGVDCMEAGCAACPTTYCVDGVCCNLDCTGACGACSVAAGADSNGTCKVFAAGSPGSPVCAPQACNGSSLDCVACAHDSECPSGDYCAANGTCLGQKDPGDVCNLAQGSDCKEGGCGACSTAYCVDNVCCNVDCTGACAACSVAAGADSDGTCKVFAAGSTGSPACGTQACNGSSMDCVACAHDTECPNGKYCAADGACQSRKGVGSACDLTQGTGDCKEANCQECTTGHCVDGVCCVSSCNGTCEACSSVLTGGSDGSCDPIPVDKDPEDECAPSADYPNDCGADGTCNGQRSCTEFAKVTVACGATTCTGGAVSGLLCSGEDTTCTPQSGVSCELYACDGDVCGTSCDADTDCAPTAYCTSPTCVEKVDNGGQCAEAHECSSGFCVDGVCCNSACEGQCEACAGLGADGTCVPVGAGELPMGDRPACEEAPPDEPCQARSCDGTAHDTCNGFAGADVTCQEARCDDDGQTPAAVCDGTGLCAVPDPVSCQAYLCNADGTACATSCTTDSECSVGNSCVGGKCGSVAVCSMDGSSLIDQDKVEHNCAPFKCQGNACLKACHTSSDCVSEYVCDTVTKTCTQAKAASNDQGGCGCRAVGSGRGANGTLVILLVGLGYLFRGRRRVA